MVDRQALSAKGAHNVGARVFISYSHAKEGLRDELGVHLAMLKR